ncbi:MAG: polysaccharide deacetylase family protein [Candidatus Bathyarchaeia archaeon]
MLGIWGNTEDPSVVYGLREIGSRIGIDVTQIDQDFDLDHLAGPLPALVLPETSLADDQSVQKLIKRAKTSVILAGPNRSSEINELFGVQVLDTCDYSPDVCGWMRMPEIPKRLPLFYSIPILKTLDSGTRTFCEVEAGGIHFPGIVMKTSGRQCLIRVGPQIFRSAAFLLTLSGMRASEKVKSCQLDPFGRVKLESTPVHLGGYLATPVVDYYAKILETILVETAYLKDYPFVQKWPVPGPEAFCVSLSHDIDFLAPKPSEFLPSLFFDLFSRNVARTVGRMILGVLYVLSALLTRNCDFLALIPPSVHGILRTYEPYWRLGEISLSEIRLGARSSLFFLGNSSPMDSNYNIQNPIVAEAIRKLSESGFEICCHAPFETEAHKSALRIQKQMLEDAIRSKVRGVRAHFLRFAYPETFAAYASAGFSYDSSVIFPEEVGYRASTCFPFTLYDFEQGKLVSLLEIPPVIMDRTFREKRNMNLSPELARRLCTELLEEIANLHGVLTIIWHNSGVSTRPSEDREWWRVYWSLLRECSRREARFMTLGEISSYYSVRQKTRLTLEGAENGSWNIAIESEQDYPSFALSVRLNSGEVRSALLNNSILPNSSLSKIGERVIVSLPLSRGRSMLSLKIS